jgi:hypothetical protein
VRISRQNIVLAAQTRNTDGLKEYLLTSFSTHDLQFEIHREAAAINFQLIAVPTLA